MEDADNIGNRIQVNYAKVMATKPRMLCYKNGVKFAIVEMILASVCHIVYLMILKECKAQTGDNLEVMPRDKK
jgi:hypothetical protein